MSVKESMQSSFDSIMAWVDAIAKENEALKSENATLREVLAANKIDISQEVFNIKAKYDENRQNLLNRNLDIDELGLSVRTYNCLRAADICTITDLVQYSRRELMKFRNFGRKSLSEIDNLFDRLSKQLGFNIYYEMIPMSEITKAKIWYQRGGRYSIPYDAWKAMADKEKIETYHNFV